MFHLATFPKTDLLSFVLCTPGGAGNHFDVNKRRDRLTVAGGDPRVNRPFGFPRQQHGVDHHRRGRGVARLS